MKKLDFKGSLGDQSVNLYRLTNANGISAAITNYGGRLVDLQVPDSKGRPENVIVGHSSMEAFLNNEEKHFGAVIGRCANRISGGRFRLDDRDYDLPKNIGEDHLHGGPQGFHHMVWGADQVDPQRLHLSHRSADGAEGYPGNLGVSVKYRLTDDDELVVSYTAESDSRTILNMSHHAYFNLCGATDGAEIDRHQLMINADRFTETNEKLIPTGNILAVENSPLDFRKPKAIGADLPSNHPHLKNTDGFDHNFALNEEGEGLHLAARVQEPESGRSMDIFTTEPGLQFYTCANPVENVASAFCLEPQHFPDAPNQPNFPSIELDAYETYTWKMIIALNKH